MTDPAPYVTAEAISAELGVHIQTIRKHFRDGDLPGRKVGKSWTTTRAALDAWVSGAAAVDRPDTIDTDLEHK